MLEIRDKIMNFNNIHRKSSGKSIRKLPNRTLGKLAKSSRTLLEKREESK